MKLAQREGLGGVMIWEVGQDLQFEQQGALLRAVYEQKQAQSFDEL